MRKQLAITAGILSTVFYYARFIEPKWIQTNKVRLTLPRLHPAFSGYKIVQISDIHFDYGMKIQTLRRVMKRINRQKPDLIVITGDFVSRRVLYSMDELTATLSELHATDGVMAIFGNHDHGRYGLSASLREMLRACGIINLNNTVHTLRRGEAMLHICGVDSLVPQLSRLDLVLQTLPPIGAAILLAHEPDFADVSAGTFRFDLQLSGHTHAGQVRIPFVGSLADPHHGHRYVRGLREIKNMHLYVNRGLGTVTLPLRFNCRPEITVFTLKAPHYGTEIKNLAHVQKV